MRQQLNVKLPEALVTAAKQHARAKGLTTTQLVQQALETLLYGSADSMEDRMESLEARVGRLESMASPDF